MDSKGAVAVIAGGGGGIGETVARECAEQMINHDCRGLVCLISSTRSLGTAGQINYSWNQICHLGDPERAHGRIFQKGFGP